VVGLVVAFIFAAVLAGLFYQMTLSGLAPESGVVTLAGLTAPVKVIRDAAGIPHIYAQNRLDLARALGYTQAQDRLFQLEMRRRGGGSPRRSVRRRPGRERLRLPAVRS
jgi:penicillin amidase